MRRLSIRSRIVAGSAKNSRLAEETNSSRYDKLAETRLLTDRFVRDPLLPRVSKPPG
jgi:hypothetical protein